MTNHIEELTKKLHELKEAIPEKMPASAWNSAQVDSSDLKAPIEALINMLNSYGADIAFEDSDVFPLLIKRLDFLKKNTLPQAAHSQNGVYAIPAYLLTIQQIQRQIEETIPPTDAKELSAQLTRHKRRVRSIGARLNELEPKTENLDTTVKEILEAHQVAEDLPADLEALVESRKRIKALTTSTATDAGSIANYLKEAKEHKENLEKMANDADEIIARSKQAYSAATSVGLAKAFHERAQHLQLIGAAWVAGLVVSLTLGAYFGASHLTKTSNLLASGSASGWAISLSVLLSALSLGAPTWFAWLSTRQIGQNFRLAEDYAFKASVSRAYEGYRSEAARIDADLEAKLLASALTRLDEQPLRLVEQGSPSSPLSEIFQSEVVVSASKAIPDFAAQIKSFSLGLLASKGVSNKKNGENELKAQEDVPN